MKQTQQPPFGLRLPLDLKMWVKMKSQMQDRSMNNFLVSIVRKAMESENAKNK